VHDDIDIDCDSLERALEPFHLVAVGAKFWFIDHGDLQSDPCDLPPLSREDLHANMAMELPPRVRDALASKLPGIAAYHERSWRPDIIFAHPPCRPPLERLSPRTVDRLLGLEPPPSVGRPVVEAALALPDITEAPPCKGMFKPPAGWRDVLDNYAKRVGSFGLPASVFERCSSGSFSEGAADAAASAFGRRLSVGITPGMSEHLARTWGDHGELFELPLGWTFQDNMIQNKPAIDLVVVITYDADNLPNPWEWQLHEPAPCSLMGSPWDQVPSTDDKPRAGWAPTLIAAMTRSATAAQLHLDDRRAAGGA